MRLLNRLFAWLFGYFWLPCPVCGKDFGGHETSFHREPLLIEGSDGWRAFCTCSDECGRQAEALNDMTPVGSSKRMLMKVRTK